MIKCPACNGSGGDSYVDCVYCVGGFLIDQFDWENIYQDSKKGCFSSCNPKGSSFKSLCSTCQARELYRLYKQEAPTEKYVDQAWELNR